MGKILNNLIFLKVLCDSWRILNVEFECIYMLVFNWEIYGKCVLVSYVMMRICVWIMILVVEYLNDIVG